MTRTRALILLFGLGMTTGALAEMRTYDVDARYRQEVYTALRGVLSTEGAKSPEGVQLLPTGQLLVNASSKTQEQVAAVLESIRSHQVEATPRVTLRYWAVLGTKSSPQDAGIGAGKRERKCPRSCPRYSTNSSACMAISSFAFTAMPHWFPIQARAASSAARR